MSINFTNLNKERTLDHISSKYLSNSARENELVTKDVAMRIIMNYTWSNPLAKIQYLKESGAD